MFAAHLVFADVDGHSSIPFTERVQRLEVFHGICSAAEPRGLRNSSQSFYDIDNDSLMAGFSSLKGMVAGEEVLDWALRLESQLADASVSTTFGVNLLAVDSEIDWSVCRGIVDDPRRLYLADDIYEQHGRVVRSRLVGDALIVAARLLELAKKGGFRVAVAAFQGGHLAAEWKETLTNHGRAMQIEDGDSLLKFLPAGKASWMSSRGIHPIGMRHGKPAA